MDNIYICLYCGLFSAAGIFLIPLMNRIPAAWLCDYGELPGKKHESPRFALGPGSVIPGILLGYGGLFATIKGDLCLGALVLCALWILLQISLSDQKFRIIPDQHIIFLAILSLVFILPDFLHLWAGMPEFCRIHETFLSPILGVLAGGGFLWLWGILGRLLYKKDTVGFGDVKLLAVLGLITGPSGAIFILWISALGVIFLFGIRSLTGKLRRKIPAVGTGADTVPKGFPKNELPLAPAITAAWILWWL